MNESQLLLNIHWTMALPKEESYKIKLKTSLRERLSFDRFDSENLVLTSSSLIAYLNIIFKNVASRPRAIRKAVRCHETSKICNTVIQQE